MSMFQQKNSSAGGIRRIIVNVDTGVDDYYALLLLLHADNTGLLKIEGILCSPGNTNTTNVIKNTVRLMELTNRTDIPVYKGINSSLILHDDYYGYFGDDGLGDLSYDHEPNVNIVYPGLAATGLYDLVRSNPGEISLLCLAPLTDIAITTKLYTDFLSYLKDMWILGGNYGPINQGDVGTEFNFYSDPEAARIVFENQQERNIYILPFESFDKINFSWDWRFNVLQSTLPEMEIVTAAEKSLKFDQTKPFWNVPDVYLAFCCVFPEQCYFDDIFKSAVIELQDSNTRGWLIFDKTNGVKNVKIINGLNQDQFENYMLQVAGVKS
ncbi:uncharacterized protein LOC126743409 isoform X2 [Anthonomus grandis grandis]|uniref:uncharacterized protein LOC126743409 isoform X2 n=1 Tax=Anthonomus grandis grandis TaxID=2921223 RepID=UPI0021656455|nr:uncharacterized protein LOC126743409 isoform X2 [Anthonomus grandis grandis]